MIIRSRRENAPFWGRIFRARVNSLQKSSLNVLSAGDFQFELARETSRSNRRKTNREFAVVTLDAGSNDWHSSPMESLLAEFHQRLRISDSIGQYRDQIAILLPETAKLGSMQVANELAAIAEERRIKLETSIYVYPWDDDLARKANELVAGSGDQDGFIEEQDLDEFREQVKQETTANAEETELERVSTDFSLMMGRVPFDAVFTTPWWKRATDIGVAGTLLVGLSPLFMVAGVAIKLSSRGPVFFHQWREGKDGKRFKMLKFRTMGTNAEELKGELRKLSQQDGPAFKMENDPRVTKVGRYLRKSCADELPQLINVLLGHMSLVGPRPLPVDESLECEAWQRYRLRVLPGLTCIWQVDGGRETRFSDWMRMDMRYLQKRSFLFDLKMIFRTALVAVMHRGSV